MSDSIPEQITLLRKITAPQYIGRVKIGCLAMTVTIVAGFLAVGYLLNERGLFLAALMLGAIGLGSLRDFSKGKTPHLANARRALDYFDSVSGSVRIVVEVDDSSNVYHAAAPGRAGKSWAFRFSPDGWVPKMGDYPAELRFVEGIEWPALIITDSGILYPQVDPKQEHLALPGEEAAESSQAKGYVLLGIILIAVAIGWTLISWNMYRLDARIIESGVTVEAEVVKVEHLRAKPGEDHGLVYRFSLPDGRQFERTWSEDDTRWKAYRVGDRIPVSYHPDDPERQIVEGRIGASEGSVLLFIALPGLFFFGFGVALAVSGVRKLREGKLP